jgi:integrase/recombinase XerD
MTTVVNQFKTYLSQVGYSEGTKNMLPALVSEFLVQQQVTDIIYIRQQQVKAFYEWLHTRPLKRRRGALSEMMIQHYMYALRTFFDWLELTGQIDYNPISALKFKKAQQNKRQPLTREEIDGLFAVAESLEETALLHLLYSCGLRRSEAWALNINDVHFGAQLLYVRDGKGSKRRVIPLTRRVGAALENYYTQDRHQYKAKTARDAEAFMLSRLGYRLSGSSYVKRLKQLINRAGIEKEIGPHHLRHSIATHLLQGGMSIEQVRNFLGHAVLESTQVYAKPTTEQIKQL